MNKNIVTAVCVFAFFAVLCGCSYHEVKTESEIKPITINPIHITIDVNVKVDKALDDYFGDLDKKADDMKQVKDVKPEAAAQPVSAEPEKAKTN